MGYKFKRLSALVLAIALMLALASPIFSATAYADTSTTTKATPTPTTPPEFNMNSDNTVNTDGIGETFGNLLGGGKDNDSTQANNVMSTMAKIGGKLLQIIVGFVASYYGFISIVHIVQLIGKAMNPKHNDHTISGLFMKGSGFQGFVASPIGGFVVSLTILILMFSGAGAMIGNFLAQIASFLFNLFGGLVDTIMHNLNGTV